MHIPNITHSFALRIATWTADTVKSKTHLISSVIKKLVNIRTCSAKPGRSSLKNKGYFTEESDSLNISDNTLLSSEETTSRSTALVMMIKSFLGFNRKSYDLTQDLPARFEKYRPMPISTQPVLNSNATELDKHTYVSAMTTFITESLTHSDVYNEDISRWKSQEQETYIPALIHRIMAKEIASSPQDSEKAALLRSGEADIMQQTLVSSGLWDMFAHRTNLMECKLSSVHQYIRNFTGKLAYKEPELDFRIADRVYETLFNCPNLIEDITRHAQDVIAQKLSGESQC